MNLFSTKCMSIDSERRVIGLQNQMTANSKLFQKEWLKMLSRCFEPFFLYLSKRPLITKRILVLNEFLS